MTPIRPFPKGTKRLLAGDFEAFEPANSTMVDAAKKARAAVRTPTADAPFFSLPGWFCALWEVALCAVQNGRATQVPRDLQWSDFSWIRHVAAIAEHHARRLAADREARQAFWSVCRVSGDMDVSFVFLEKQHPRRAR